MLNPLQPNISMHVLVIPENSCLMVKQLWSIVILKYCKLSVCYQRIIFPSQKQMIYQLPSAKSQDFAQHYPIIIKYHINITQSLHTSINIIHANNVFPTLK